MRLCLFVVFVRCKVFFFSRGESGIGIQVETAADCPSGVVRLRR